MNRDMLSRRLKKRGFDIQIAIDGQQGIDMAVAGLPDLILLDMSLPIVDGWEAARQLKGQDSTRAIPIIALTARPPKAAGDTANAMPIGDTTTVGKVKDVEGVFVVQDGLARFRPVKVGIAGDEYFEVLSGLEPGDTVVSGSYQAIRDLADSSRVKRIVGSQAGATP